MQNHKLFAFMILVIIAMSVQACAPAASPAMIQETNIDPPPDKSIQLTVNQADFNPFSHLEIQFQYSIKNTGSVPLPGPVTVTGTNVTCPAVNTVGNMDNLLDMNEELRCESSYTITQADLDKGSVTITAFATVDGIVSNESESTVALNEEPDEILTLSITVSPATYSQVGQMVVFTYVIKNLGTMDVGPAQFTVSDPRYAPFNCGDANTTLAQNATVTCTGNYSVTQADMDAASISTSATTSGGGAGPSKPASITITKSIASLTLTSSVNPLTYNQNGQEIAFAYSIQNTGTVSLGPAQFTVNVKGTTWALPCGPENTTLAPNENVSCATTYFVQQNELTYPNLTFNYYAQGGGAEANSVTVTVNNASASSDSFTSTNTLPQDLPPTYPYLTLSVGTNCRTGPGTAFEVVGIWEPNKRISIRGKHPTENYWIVESPYDPGTECWIVGSYVAESGNLADVSVYPVPPTPTSTPVTAPGFEANAAGLDVCTGGWWVEIGLKNLGAIAFKSMTISVKDTVTDVTLSSSVNEFTNKDGCLNSTSISKLDPAGSFTVSAPPFSVDPTGHQIVAKLKLCTEDDQGGQCGEKIITFTP